MTKIRKRLPMPVAAHEILSLKMSEKAKPKHSPPLTFILNDHRFDRLK